MSKHMSLFEIPPGDTATIIEVHGDKILHDRLKALGIRLGTKVTKVSNSFARGPVVVQHGQTQTALGSGICRKIVLEVPE